MSKILSTKNAGKLDEFWNLVKSMKSYDIDIDKISDEENRVVFNSVSTIINDNNILAGMAIMYYKSSNIRIGFKKAYREYINIAEQQCNE